MKGLFNESEIPFQKNTPKEEIATCVIDFYKQEAELFLTYALASFLSITTTGDSETFYVHSLTKYMPVFLRRTCDDHKLGVGVFTMEGFESKNYSSKHAIREHSNRKGNVCLQSLKYLTLQFVTRHARVQEEIKKRARRKKDRTKIVHKRKQTTTTISGTVT